VTTGELVDGAENDIKEYLDQMEAVGQENKITNQPTITPVSLFVAFDSLSLFSLHTPSPPHSVDCLPGHYNPRNSTNALRTWLALVLPLSDEWVDILTTKLTTEGICSPNSITDITAQEWTELGMKSYHKKALLDAGRAYVEYHRRRMERVVKTSTLHTPVPFAQPPPSTTTAAAASPSSITPGPPAATGAGGGGTSSGIRTTTTTTTTMNVSQE